MRVLLLILLVFPIRFVPAALFASGGNPWTFCFAKFIIDFGKDFFVLPLMFAEY